MRSYSAPAWSSYGSSRNGRIPAARRTDDVVRVGVTHIRDVLGLHVDHVESEREDRRIGLGDADDRRVDDDHDWHAFALADLAHAEPTRAPTRSGRPRCSRLRSALRPRAASAARCTESTIGHRQRCAVRVAPRITAASSRSCSGMPHARDVRRVVDVPVVVDLDHRRLEIASRRSARARATRSTCPRRRARAAAR